MIEASDQLEVRLLGQPSLKWQEQTVAPSSQKGRALLYLASLGPLTRAAAAELLWSPERLQNVRQELRLLRLLPGADDWLSSADPVTVTGLIDVFEFQNAVEAADYSRAISLYQGPLLAGFTVDSAPAFNDWLETERARLQDLLYSALQAEGARLEGLLEYQEALAVVRRLLVLDPLDEGAYQSLMRLNYKRGDLAAALAVYEECRRALLREVGAEPLPDTTGLYDFIRTEDLRQTGSRQAGVSGMALHLARALALLEDDVTLGVLARALEVSELEVANYIGELEAAGYLEGHILSPARAASLRADIPASVELQLESRIAAALAAAGSAPDVVARHLLRSPEKAAAIPYLRAAAVDAHDALDTTRALELLQQAAGVAADRRERVEVLLEVERLAALVGNAELRDETLAETERQVHLLQEDIYLVEVGFRRIQRLLETGDPLSASVLAEDAVAASRRIERPEMLARALLMLGGAHFHSGEMTAALVPFREALSFATDQERLRALNNVATVLGIQGELAEALVHLEEALTLARKQGQREVVAGLLNNIGATAERMARFDLAIRRFQEAARLSHDLGNFTTEATALLNVVDIKLKLGTTEDCPQMLAKAAEVAKLGLGGDRLQSRLSTLQGLLARNLGDMELAIEHLQRALELSRSLGEEHKTVLIRYNLEFTRLLAGEEDHQVAEAVEQLESVGPVEVLPWVYAELGQAAGDAEAARQWADKLSAHVSNERLKELQLAVLERAEAL